MQRTKYARGFKDEAVKQVDVRGHSWEVQKGRRTHQQRFEGAASRDGQALS